jgi:hypothetical protein
MIISNITPLFYIAREASDGNAPRSKKQKLNFSEIKCICLNVCGIKSKLLLPEFIQLITSQQEMT